MDEVGGVNSNLIHVSSNLMGTLALQKTKDLIKYASSLSHVAIALKDQSTDL